MICISGKASRSFHPIIGVVAKNHRPIFARKNTIFVTEELDKSCIGYKACISSGRKGYFFHPDHIYNCKDIEILHDGDIVRIDATGCVSVLWEIKSHQNAFMITEACNCKCIMCPQPPRQHSPQLLQEAQCTLNLLKNKYIKQICITGGEPTLLGNNFIDFLHRCINEHPAANIDILTNGKNFSDREFTRNVAQVATNNVCFCVSLHSDIDTLHDNIVGANGSFSKTSLGLYNLAEYGCKIEIRHVINKYNYRRLINFAEHIYNYFPFCSHYAFMGMELYGNAASNKKEVDISPLDYRDELSDAILYLKRRGLPISIYNIPLCLCRKEVREFARQSISSWKNLYVKECDNCDLKKDYAGFFSTSVSLPINHIKPMKGVL